MAELGGCDGKELEMTGKTSWERFFDEHAAVYDENEFTKNTLAEVGYVEKELSLSPGAAILDVGCGTGRHSIELAKRGYAVTGLDFSSAMLAKAKQAARAAGVDVNWIQSDATRFSFPGKFDAAICLCEGAFGLLGQGDDPIAQPLAIVKNISRSLKPGGKAMFTVLNGVAMIRRQKNEDVAAGHFDPVALVTSGEYPPREGCEPIAVREHGFVGTELVLLFGLAGLGVERLCGGTAGSWRTGGGLDLDEMEIMVVARKTGDPAAVGLDWPGA